MFLLLFFVQSKPCQSCTGYGNLHYYQEVVYHYPYCQHLTETPDWSFFGCKCRSSCL